MARKQLIHLATALAALAVLMAAIAGTASAASNDYNSPDGICYTTGWCHWSEVCYDTFGGCYFDFWCPQGATEPSQCQYDGGFAPYTSAASSASGPGETGTATSSASGGAATTTTTTNTTSTGGGLDGTYLRDPFAPSGDTINDSQTLNVTTGQYQSDWGTIYGIENSGYLGIL